MGCDLKIEVVVSSHKIFFFFLFIFDNVLDIWWDIIFENCVSFRFLRELRMAEVSVLDVYVSSMSYIMLGFFTFTICEIQIWIFSAKLTNRWFMLPKMYMIFWVCLTGSVYYVLWINFMFYFIFVHDSDKHYDASESACHTVLLIF